MECDWGGMQSRSNARPGCEMESLTLSFFQALQAPWKELSSVFYFAMTKIELNE